MVCWYAAGIDHHTWRQKPQRTEHGRVGLIEGLAA